MKKLTQKFFKSNVAIIFAFFTMIVWMIISLKDVHSDFAVLEKFLYSFSFIALFYQPTLWKKHEELFTKSKFLTYASIFLANFSILLLVLCGLDIDLFWSLFLGSVATVCIFVAFFQVALGFIFDFLRDKVKG